MVGPHVDDVALSKGYLFRSNFRYLATNFGRLVKGPYKKPICRHLCHLLFNSHRIHWTGIFSYIYHKNQPNVGKYVIHGWYGNMYGLCHLFFNYVETTSNRRAWGSFVSHL